MKLLGCQQSQITSSLRMVPRDGRQSGSWLVQQRGNSVEFSGWSTQRPANAGLSSGGGFCGMIVPFVKPVAEPSSKA
jgi:hypothetical protein